METHDDAQAAGPARTSRWRWVVAGVAALAVVAGGIAVATTSGGGDEGPREAPRSTAPLSSRPSPPGLDKRPNILLVMTDDMRWDELQYLPNVRRHITDRGLLWRNSFATTPLCCPNRASFLTGELTHNHKVWWHDAPYGYGAFDDSRTLATSLQAAGYQTGYVGKYLNRYGLMKPHEDPDARPSTYVPAGWDEWRASPDGTRLPESDPREGGTYDYFDHTVNVNGTLVGHEGEYSSAVTVDDSVAALERFTGPQGEGRPWYLQVNSVAPHTGSPQEDGDPFVGSPARPEWVKGRFDADIPRSPGVPESGEPEPENADKPGIVGEILAFTDRDRTAVRDSARQRAEALFALDRELERVFDLLEERGELATTRLVFTSDNGYLLGEHRLRAGKNLPYEPSYRVPLVMAGPGIPHGDRVAPVTTIDVSATVAEWAGAALPAPDGRSLTPDIRTSRGWPRATLFEAGTGSTAARDPSMGPGRRVMGVRTGRFAYIRYATGTVELYDMVRDPNQLRDVAGRPAYADVQAQLERVLLRLKDCAGRECQVDLPRDLVVGEQALRRITAAQERAKTAYYGS